MELHWRPVGPETAQTYWQRRAVALLVVLLVLLTVVLLLSRIGGGTDAVAESAPSPAPSPRPASSAPSPSAGPRPCTDDELEVAATAERSSYPVGGRPRLTLSVTSTADSPCTRDLGQAAVGILVYSGNDRIWSSDDCAPGGPSAVRTLAPGEAETFPVTWAGIRSQPQCSGDQAAAAAGTYRVRGRVGELEVTSGTFVLEG